jgi:hypothetical protein
MHSVLRLCEDILSNNDAIELALPARPRMVFVVHGSVAIDGRAFGDGEGCEGPAWHGEGEATLKPGPHGAACWRFELAPAGGGSTACGPGIRSQEKLSAVLDPLPKGELLLRGDSVAFPPGGCAYLHTHQGPGIRCLIEGGIRIDTHGRSTSYGPGGAWFEAGPEPVFAQAAADRPSRFVRVMILPRALIGKSSLALVNEADKSRPRPQQYKIFADMPIATPG